MFDIDIPETALIGFVLALGFGIFGLVMVKEEKNSNFAFLMMFLVGITISSEIAGWLPRWVLLLCLASISIYLSLKWSIILRGGGK